MTISRLIRFLVRELGPCMLCGVAKKTKNTSPECIYMTDSLCCTLETNATLLISYVGVVQSSTHVWLFATPWTAARQDSLSLTISRSLPKFMFIALVMPSSHLILWHPLLLLPSTFPSIRDFSSESAVHLRWPKYWGSALASVLPMSIQGWFSFRLIGLVFLLSKELSEVFSSTIYID